MATVASPTLLNTSNNNVTYSPAPKSGILLNPYPPGWSPRMSHVQSLPLPEGPAFRSSAPNTPNMQPNGINHIPLPRTDSRSSSNSGSISATGGSSAHNGKHSRANSTRIRFAPLPDPRKLEEAELLDSPLAVQNNNLTLPATTTDDTLLASPTTPGSQYSHVSANSAISANTASTANPFAYNLPDDGFEPGSDNGGIMSTITSATKQKSKRWSKTLFKPLFKSTSMASSSASAGGDAQSDDAMWRTSSRDSFQSATSTDGLGLFRRMTTDGSTRPSSAGRNAAARPSSMIGAVTGNTSRPSSAGNGAAAGFGAPLTRVQSAGTAGARSARKNTKMLNGHVYGARSANNAFQNIRDEEPSFVEWGPGGAGSVNRNSGGGVDSKYASIQSADKVSIGAVSGGDGGQMAGDDYDDGSGVAWIRKRKKERAEKEARERAEAAERAAREPEGQASPDQAQAVTGASTQNEEQEKTSASTADPLSHRLTDDGGDTQAHEEGREQEQSQARAVPMKRSPSMTVETVSPRQGTPINVVQASSSTSGTGTHTPATITAATSPGQDEHHIVQAVTLPAPPHSHSSHAHGHGHGPASEAMATPKGSASSPGSPPVLSPGKVESSDVVASPELQSPLAPPSSKSSSDSDSESSDDEDDEREEDESETDEEDDAKNEQRKTSVCAGVEKISRHKDLEQQ
ncbi:hypothetical protein M408DRAFT_329135 [Serendipita vermifera MAFF 305830]|uniref:Uncharacterized protein n=1 Tax=Serendipita vermifera MAFF 305830 TaxID=933852 RepID=A0A0C2WSP5_SERVB|nr:hypothetical protein M408DRAFT_329135 [Serendipita vermifera MAFF 305830]